MIEVRTTNDVLIDGEHAGKVLDIVANYPQRRAELQAALEAYETGVAQARQAELTELRRVHAVDIQELAQAHQEKLDALAATHQAAIDGRDEQLLAKSESIAERDKAIAAQAETIAELQKRVQGVFALPGKP